MRKIKKNLLATLVVALVATLAAAIGFMPAKAKSGGLPGIDTHYGEFSAVYNEGGDLIGVKPSELNASMKAAVILGKQSFGGAYGANFVATYKQEVPAAGNAGFFAGASTNENGIINVWQTVRMYFRMDSNGCFLISNGAIAQSAAWRGEKIPAAGDVVDVTVTVQGEKATFVVQNDGAECMWLGGDVAGEYAQGLYAGFACADALAGKIIDFTIKNVDTQTEFKLYEAAAPEEKETFRDELHGDFSVRFGSWQQTDTDDVTKVKTLKNSARCEDASGPKADAACVMSDFGGLLGENFNIKYDITVPCAGGTAGFVFRGTYTGSTFSIYESKGVYLRNDLTCMYVLSGGAVLAKEKYSEKVAENEIVSVEAAVSGTTLAVKMTKADGTTIIDVTVENIASSEAGTCSGFVCERYSPEIRNVTVTSGENHYKAYPFEYVEPIKENVFTDTALGDVMNPNFSVMCGTMKQATDGSRLETTATHLVYGTSSIISGFGGVYGENFEIEFDVSAPTEEEKTIYEGAANGFLFRATDPTNCYTGIYFCVQADKAFILDGENDRRFGFVFDKRRYGGLFTLKATVSGNDITVSFADQFGKIIPFTYNGVGNSMTTKTLAGILCDYADGQYAGFASDRSNGKFQNVKMTSGEKEFVAFPFAEGKEDLSENYKVVSADENDKVVPADVDNPDLLKADYDIINEGFSYIIYTDYNGQAHDIKVVDKNGNDIPDEYVLTINYKKPPYTTMESWTPQTKAERHGIYVTVSDADGYVYANIKCALRIRAIELTIEGVVAENREYDATRSVKLSGGRLIGVMAGDEVSFELGDGSVNSAKAGDNKEVSTYILLMGKDARNYTLVQPELTVNIAKAKQQAPDAPRIASKTSNGVTLLETDDTMYMEFKLDDGEWQDSLVFENVTKGAHKIYARYVGDANNEASEPSEALEFTLGEQTAASGCGGSVNGLSVFACSVAAAAFVLLAKKKER